MPQITWLHLSDWHQKGEEFNRNVVRDALLKDIRNRSELSSALSALDFIVFSGDIASRGQENEYANAVRHLLAPLLEACGLGPERLFIVPGNHDLDRCAFELLPPPLHNPLENETDVQKWLCDEERKSLFLRPFKAYNQFVSNYGGGTLSAYGSIALLDAGGKSVALLCINSALMCGRNKTAKGEVDDYGKLIIGEPQIHDLLKEPQVANADVRIVIMHHPFEWLAGFDRDRVEDKLRREAHFILCGHQHSPRVSVEDGTSGKCVIITAGASYDRREPESSRYANSYNLVHLDFEKGRGVAFLRCWNGTKWREDVDSSTQGRFEFILPKELGKAAQEQAATTDKPDSRPCQPDIGARKEGEAPAPNPARYDVNNFVFNIPYREKGDGVVGREDALAQVRRQLAAGKRTAIGHTAAFQGIGGLGKTQLAVEYAYRHKQDYPKGVIWIHADQDIDAQLIRLAKEAAWLAPQSEHALLLEVARHRLRTFSGCLIIFDNVEKQEDIEPYLPEAKADPHILVTSRTPQRDFVPIELQVLNDELAFDLLLKESGRAADSICEDEQAAARKIAATLGGLPLAIEIAGAYLNRLTAVTFRQYDRILQADIQNALQQGHLSSFTRHEKDIFRTLRISAQVFSEAPLLEEILNLLAWSGTSFMGLPLMAAILGKQESELYHPLGLGCSLRLLNKEKEGERYEIHRLLGRVHQEQFPLNEKTAWIERVCHRLGDWFEERREKFTELAVFEAELDHLKAWLDHARKHQLTKHLVRLTWLQAYPPYHWGKYHEAHRLVLAAHRLLERGPTVDEKLRANVLDDLGATLNFLGKPGEALPYAEAALDIRRQNLGEEHPDTAASFSSIGSKLNELGRYKEALEHHQRALAIRLKLFGEEHPDTAASLNNIGETLGELGRYEEALEHHQRALAIRFKLFGEEHPDTADSLNNIGVTLRKLGSYEEALEHQKRALAIRLKLFGEEHPATSNSLGNTGGTLGQLGSYEEALEHQKRALAIRSKLFGEEHPETATSLNNTGLALRQLGSYKEALEHCQRALAIQRKLFKIEHPTTRIFAKNTLDLLIKMRKYLEAQQLLDDLLKGLSPDSAAYGDLAPWWQTIHRASTRHGFRSPSAGAKGKKKKRKGR